MRHPIRHSLSRLAGALEPRQGRPRPRKAIDGHRQMSRAPNLRSLLLHSSYSSSSTALYCNGDENLGPELQIFVLSIFDVDRRLAGTWLSRNLPPASACPLREKALGTGLPIRSPLASTFSFQHRLPRPGFGQKSPCSAKSALRADRWAADLRNGDGSAKAGTSE